MNRRYRAGEVTLGSPSLSPLILMTACFALGLFLGCLLASFFQESGDPHLFSYLEVGAHPDTQGPACVQNRRRTRCSAYGLRRPDRAWCSNPFGEQARGLKCWGGPRAGCPGGVQCPGWSELLVLCSSQCRECSRPSEKRQ